MIRHQSRNRLQEQLVVLQDRLVSADEKLAEDAKSHKTLLKQLENLEAGIQHHRQEAEEFYQALRTVQNQHGQDKEQDTKARNLVQLHDQAMQTIARLQKQLADVEDRLAQGTAVRQASPGYVYSRNADVGCPLTL